MHQAKSSLVIYQLTNETGVNALKKSIKTRNYGLCVMMAEMFVVKIAQPLSRLFHRILAHP